MARHPLPQSLFTPLPLSSHSLEWCEEEFEALADFGARSRIPQGFGHLDAQGHVNSGEGAQLWINCRMTYVFCLAYMRGDATYKDLAQHGVHSLLEHFYDPEFGGFFSTLGAEAQSAPKEGYAHAFVLLAASAAVQATIPRAQELLDLALEAHHRHFWEPENGLVRESWNRDFTQTEDYRGVNSTMHTLEAILALWDTTGDLLWLERAESILRFVLAQASHLGWRVGEHYTSEWIFLPTYNSHQPADPFRPYALTPGHALEWSRLALQFWAARRQTAHEEADATWLAHIPEQALLLFERAMADAWAVDGARGFVYTTDFEGNPVVHERMHWTLCEGISAASAFARYAQEEDNRELEQRMLSTLDELISYARSDVIEAPGRWRHELDQHNQLSTRTWDGKPDIYHAAQAMLMPFMPLTPSFAAALRRSHESA